MQAEKQPEICFLVVSNRRIGLKAAYWTLFPAKFPAKSCLTQELDRAAWAGVPAARFLITESASLLGFRLFLLDRTRQIEARRSDSSGPRDYS
jgi:hypothetical protein